MPIDDLVFNTRNQFQVLSVDRVLDTATVYVQGVGKSSKCPYCDKQSKSVHSFYFRKISDLPAFGNTVIIHLKTRKFYCYNLKCERRVFAERFTTHFTPYKRSSDRLREKLLKIALLSGGNAGHKLCKTLNIPASSSTLIRLIHEQPLHLPVPPQAVGIDDWAFRKGINYGTALIDLNRRKIIDLLPDRETQTVANWLTSRPYIKVITRDRFSRYAKAVTLALPKATQVADRWHLIKNMGDALTKLLERKRQEIRTSARLIQPASPDVLPKAEPKINLPALPLTKRQLQLKQIKQLRSEGLTIRAIARVLIISRVTVRKYLQLDEPPRKNGNRTNIESFNDYIQSRMKENKNIEVIQLWKEIKQQGYNGGRTAVYIHLRDYVKPKNRIKLPTLNYITWVPTRVSLLLYKKEASLSQKEKELLKEIRDKCPEIGVAQKLAHKFRDIIENKQGDLLCSWMNEVQESPVKELKRFAKGLLSDFVAVKNAISLPWSNGPVEGKINKLKTIKRQMYGRASFDLLRKRLVLSDMDST